MGGRGGRLIQGIEGIVKTIVRKGEMQRVPHLISRVSPRAGVGHGKRRRQALGRKEKVALRFGGAHHVQGEREIVASDFAKCFVRNPSDLAPHA